MSAIMSFGMFAFSIPTLLYDQLQIKTDYRYGRTGRVGARDATQFIGPGDQTISLSGSVYDEISDGVASLDKLHAMATLGEAQPLLCSNGRVYGNFVITGVDEQHRVFATDGTPIAIDFGIDFLRVDDDDVANASTATNGAADPASAATAIASTAAAETEGVSASGLTKNIGKLKDLTTAATAKIGQVNQMMDRLAPQISSMTRLLSDLGIVDARALSGIRETITVLGRGAAMKGAQAGALLDMGLSASGVASGMAADPQGTVNDVISRIKAQPTAKQASTINALFGTSNAPVIGELVRNADQITGGA